MKILETERLILREITVDDAAFALDLLNQPSFIKYIGDRGVRDLDQSRDFIENRYRKSYHDHGYGLYVVDLKDRVTDAETQRHSDGESVPSAEAGDLTSANDNADQDSSIPHSAIRIPRSIGFCGFVRRTELPAPDIGFAFLPQYERKGYGFESANAILRYGVEKLSFDRVLAITSQDNESSSKLLGKLGFNYDRLITMPNGEVLKLFQFEASETDIGK